jgi:hypothetical protein
MFCDKPPSNNREVPLNFMRKLWDEFIMGKHVNYFDIGELQGLGLESAQDRENARCDDVLGPHPPRRRSGPPTQHPPIADNLQQVKLSISSLTCSLVQHNVFVALSGKEVPANDIDRGVGGLA